MAWRDLVSKRAALVAVIAVLCIVLLGRSTTTTKRSHTWHTLTGRSSWAPNATRLQNELYRLTQYENSRTLCVIARAYGGQATMLPTFLLSMAHLGIKTRILLLNTDASMSTEELAQGSRLVNALLGRPEWATFLPMAPPPLNHRQPDYGYAQTDQALQFLYDNEHLYDCEHVLVTNADNFYVNNFASHVMDGLSNPLVDMIGFNFISHYRVPPPTETLKDGLIDAHDGTHTVRNILFEVDESTCCSVDSAGCELIVRAKSTLELLFSASPF